MNRAREEASLFLGGGGGCQGDDLIPSGGHRDAREAAREGQVIDLKGRHEKAPYESGMYIRWYADNIWLFVPV